MSRSETIEQYLSRLGSNDPTPGAGAVGAIHAAQAAALIGMVANFSKPPEASAEGGSVAAAEHGRSGTTETDLESILSEADELMRTALQEAESDEEKFQRVVDCYKLPSGSDEERAKRSAAIREALVEATLPARAQLDLATAVVRLGEELLDVCKSDLLSDIAVAAEAARAAAATARITVEANLASIAEDSLQESLREHTQKADRVVRRAEELSALVRQRLLR
ncbi:cyclodeaminase/cyclohydrolase family protein [Arthrobacter sulfonylureivorans]|uniref:Cyclodeaminase/cyclohydrolase family protein n=1 Tax=Arthrobacter sulfonylureivorans TaxID=2486855 RepID=A0ABY3W6C0_9MICC|nr:cyclodeaminase/cyclohydrolase family protein [Arthrobacter sulfonylureivorans]UNK45824.1 cyclodeaminase/cyclohydrolase family protein [Arthrobacter sulfonylureivorans]